MKNIFFLMAISLLFALTSCNEEDTPKNYWQSNDLKKLQLKGKVRTILDGYYECTFEFDNKGRIVKVSENDDAKSLTDNKKKKASIFAPAMKFSKNSRAANSLPISRSNSTWYELFKYNSAGQLVAFEVNDYGDKYYAAFEYGKHGAFAPFENEISEVFEEFYLYDFKKNLTKIKYTVEEYPNDIYTYTIGVSGNDMKIYAYEAEYEDGELDIYRDTTHITLNSAKFPAKIKYDNDYTVNFSYYDNNMLKEIKNSYVTTTFIKDDDYLLIEKIGANNGNWSETYTYNEKKELIKVVDGDYITEYTYSDYDDHGNYLKWTAKETSPWYNEENTYTRVITYY